MLKTYFRYSTNIILIKCKWLLSIHNRRKSIINLRSSKRTNCSRRKFSNSIPRPSSQSNTRLKRDTRNMNLVNLRFYPSASPDHASNILRRDSKSKCNIKIKTIRNIRWLLLSVINLLRNTLIIKTRTNEALQFQSSSMEIIPSTPTFIKSISWTANIQTFLIILKICVSIITCAEYIKTYFCCT